MLTNNEIAKQINNGNITIDNLRIDALNKPNSCIVSITDTLYTFDYSLMDTKDGANLLNELKTGNLHTLKPVKIPKDGLLLEPRKVYLTKTKERVKTNGYVPILNGRTSLSLLGVSIELNSGTLYDGFDGEFLLSIIATAPTIIYPNIEIGNLTFFNSLQSSRTQGMLSGEEIKNKLDSGELIINEPDKIVINPNSVNLTLNEKIGYYTDPILDMKKENNLEYFNLGEMGEYLYPDKIYVARTNEWTETNNYVPMMSGRSSLGRLGYHVHCSAGMGSLGYKGYWHMGTRPTMPIKVFKDMKSCQIYYYTAEGEITDMYNGVMQNLSGDQLGSQFHKKLVRK